MPITTPALERKSAVQQQLQGLDGQITQLEDQQVAQPQRPGVAVAGRLLEEAARVFRLSAWMRFWRVEVAFAMPQLIWNMMLSMSGSWFFVVASEAISVGNTTVLLPGMGSYISLAIEQKSLAAVAWAIAGVVPTTVTLPLALRLLIGALFMPIRPPA